MQTKKTSKAARGRKDMRALLVYGVYDVFPVPERTKESRFFLLNACAQASRVQFMLRSPGVERNN